MKKPEFPKSKGALSGLFTLAAVHTGIAAAITYATGNHDPAQVAGLSLLSAISAEAFGGLGMYSGLRMLTDGKPKDGAGVLGQFIGGLFLTGLGAGVGYAGGAALPYVARAFMQ